jgi:UTP-glucose-1-phosphate uridylyltransferase/mevalonate kinase
VELASEGENMNIFVSGRLCLFGEHSDWAGFYNRTNADIKPGLAIVTGIEQGITAFVDKYEAGIRFRTIVPDGNKTEWKEWPLSARSLRAEAKDGGFYSYVTGVAAFMLEYYDVGGISIDVTKMTMPLKKGLSSSAAICVLVARSFNALYNLQMTVRSEMEAAYRGEIMTPSRCGRLDQACAYGERPVLMRFASENIEVERLGVGKDLYWVFADLKGQKDTRKILSALNSCYPFAMNDTAREVQKALGEENERIVNQVIEAMRVGDAPRIGALMNEAQRVFDSMVAPACPEELAAPLLHAVIADKTVQELALGCKGVGSQGDGTVQFICKNETDQAALCMYLGETKGLEPYVFTIRAQHSVRKAIVPLAGFGTRLFPATKAVKKEFFPIIDYDGLMKPALMILLEELHNAGIEEIALIIQPGDQEEYDNLFKRDVRLEHYRKLPADKRDYNVRIQTIGRKIRYIEQKEQLGFGHAVYQAKTFAGDDPVLMVLGDHIYHSENSVNCAGQLIEAYERNGMLTIGIDEVNIDRVQHYGILAGEFIDDDMRVMQVREMKEKPTADYAVDYLGTARKGKERYYSAFGQYVLIPKVFELLERNIVEENLEGGEYQLTSALEDVRAEFGMIGYRIDGQRFDIGLPEEYRETLSRFGKKETRIGEALSDNLMIKGITEVNPTKRMERAAV